MAQAAHIVLMLHRPDAIAVVMSEPDRCGCCNTARVLFVNRAGQTVCAVCDALAHPAGRHGDREIPLEANA